MSLRILLVSAAASSFLAATPAMAVTYHCPPAGTKVVRKLDSGLTKIAIYKGEVKPAPAGGAPLCGRDYAGENQTLRAGMYTDNEWGRDTSARLVKLLAGGPGTVQQWRHANFQSAWDNRFSFDSVGHMQIGGVDREVYLLTSEQKGTGGNWFDGIWRFSLDSKSFALVKYSFELVRGQGTGGETFTATSITVPGQ